MWFSSEVEAVMSSKSKPQNPKTPKAKAKAFSKISIAHPPPPLSSFHQKLSKVIHSNNSQSSSPLPSSLRLILSLFSLSFYPYPSIRPLPSHVSLSFSLFLWFLCWVLEEFVGIEMSSLCFLEIVELWLVSSCDGFVCDWYVVLLIRVGDIFL